MKSKLFTDIVEQGDAGKVFSAAVKILQILDHH